MKLKLISSLLATLVTFFSVSAFSQVLGVTFGIKQTDINRDATYSAHSSGSGNQLGVLAYSPLNQNLMARVGALYAERNFTLTSGATNSDVNLKYLDVPLTLSMQLFDKMHVFAGGVFSLNVAKSCSTPGAACSPSGVVGNHLLLSAGFGFRIIDSVGLEIVIEQGSSKVMDGVTSMANTGINLQYLIE